MSIRFIYLPHPYLRSPDAQLPLGILYLAAACRRAGYDVAVDNLTRYTNAAEAVESVPESTVFGITATCLELPMADEMARLLRRKYPYSTIILGGPGCNSVSEDLHDHSLYDAIFVGEADESLVKYLNTVKLEPTSGPLYIMTSDPPKNLDRLSQPSRDLIHGNLGGKIFAGGREYFPGGSTTILSSRGCPYHCSFCAEAGTKVRFRPPSDVVAEMVYVYARHGIRQFRFSDDSFTLDKDRVMEFCRLLQGGTVEFAWRVSCRVKPLDSDMLRAMVDAGCREFSFGIESFDNKVLHGLGKNTTAMDNMIALEKVREAGGKSRILFMVRTPFQTANTMVLNKAYLDHAPYETIACTSFVPLPGSAIWKYPEMYRVKIVNRNMSDYNFYFYGPSGRNQIKRLFLYLDRDTDEVESESEEFRSYLESTGRLNNG